MTALPGADDEIQRVRHRARYQELIGEYVGRADWPPGLIQAERTRALRELIAVAVARSPWHRARLAGIDPGEVTEADLASLPVMTKTDLMANFDEIVTDPRLTRQLCESHLGQLTGNAYLLDGYHVVTSGGSSGQRGVFVYGWDAWAICFASIARFQRRAWAADPGLAGIPRRSATIATWYPRHLSAAIHTTFSRPGARTLFSVGQPVEQIVAGLNKLQPTVLTCYSSFLPRLTREAAAGRLRITPRQVVGVAEPLLPEIAAAASQAWGVPAVTNYGMSEGMFARSCGHSLHLPDDLCIVEPAGADGRPARRGEASRSIYLTNLYNHVLPLIRFEVPDEVMLLDRPCHCGSAFRCIASPRGRREELFTYPGDLVVHPQVFCAVLGSHPGIIEYQVRQTQRGAQIAVQADGEAATGRTGGLTGLLGKQVRACLESIGLTGPEVSVTTQQTALERTPAGKLRRFVPLPP